MADQWYEVESTYAYVIDTQGTRIETNRTVTQRHDRFCDAMMGFARRCEVVRCDVENDREGGVFDVCEAEVVLWEHQGVGSGRVVSQADFL